MDSRVVKKWLVDRHPSGYHDKSFDQFILMCCLISDKIFDPEIKECSFVEAVHKEDWVKAKAVGDLWNKEAIEDGLYQDFVKFVKTSSEYILKMREEKLNILEI